MRRAGLAALILLMLAGCAGRREADNIVTPGGRLLQHDSRSGVFKFCDGTTAIFKSTATPEFQVVPGGCPTGVP